MSINSLIKIEKEMFQLPPNDFYSWCVQIRVPDIPVLQMRRWRHQVTQLVSSELEFECRLPRSRAPFSNIVTQHRESTQHVGAPGRLFLHVPTPSPTPPLPPWYLSALPSLFTPVPLVPLIVPDPSYSLSCLRKSLT